MTHLTSAFVCLLLPSIALSQAPPVVPNRAVPAPNAGFATRPTVPINSAAELHMHGHPASRPPNTPSGQFATSGQYGPFYAPAHPEEWPVSSRAVKVYWFYVGYIKNGLQSEIDAAFARLGELGISVGIIGGGLGYNQGQTPGSAAYYKTPTQSFEHEWEQLSKLSSAQKSQISHFCMDYVLSGQKDRILSTADMDFVADQILEVMRKWREKLPNLLFQLSTNTTSYGWDGGPAYTVPDEWQFFGPDVTIDSKTYKRINGGGDLKAWLTRLRNRANAHPENVAGVSPRLDFDSVLWDVNYDRAYRLAASTQPPFRDSFDNFARLIAAEQHCRSLGYKSAINFNRYNQSIMVNGSPQPVEYPNDVKAERNLAYMNDFLAAGGRPDYYCQCQWGGMNAWLPESSHSTTWLVKAVAENLYGLAIVADDFDDNNYSATSPTSPTTWTLTGSWNAGNGVAGALNNSVNRLATPNGAATPVGQSPKSVGNCEIQLSLKLRSADTGSAGVVFCSTTATSINSGYSVRVLNVTGTGGSQRKVKIFEGSVDKASSGSITLGNPTDWTALRIVNDGGLIHVYVDGSSTPAVSYDDRASPLAAGRVILFNIGTVLASFDDVSFNVVPSAY